MKNERITWMGKMVAAQRPFWECTNKSWIHLLFRLNCASAFLWRGYAKTITSSHRDQTHTENGIAIKTRTRIHSQSYGWLIRHAVIYKRIIIFCLKIFRTPWISLHTALMPNHFRSCHIHCHLPFVKCVTRLQWSNEASKCIRFAKFIEYLNLVRSLECRKRLWKYFWTAQCVEWN